MASGLARTYPHLVETLGKDWMGISGRVLCISLFCLVPCVGCVDRVLWVRSDPPGADVWVEGKPVGQTPVQIPFVYYGTHHLLVRAPGHASVSQNIRVRAPVWQWFPLDFVAENLVPFRLRDEHTVNLRLPSLTEGASQEEGLLQRAAELKVR